MSISLTYLQNWKVWTWWVNLEVAKEVQSQESGCLLDLEDNQAVLLSPPSRFSWSTARNQGNTHSSGVEDHQPQHKPQQEIFNLTPKLRELTPRYCSCLVNSPAWEAHRWALGKSLNSSLYNSCLEPLWASWIFIFKTQTWILSHMTWFVAKSKPFK